MEDPSPASADDDKREKACETGCVPRPPARPGKLAGWQFYHETLGAPRYVVAPMVDQSELAWRMLARRHGAHLCFTPMLHAAVFLRSEAYRREWLDSCAEDRPLIAQFCANDPATLLAAARLAEPHVDAVDLNLGCPQNIAKRGRYGAFLQEDWPLIHALVSACHEGLAVPVTAKIRVQADPARTLAYAAMLADAGAQMLTVHGRTREQKGVDTGLASWPAIAAVVASLPSLPVVANGNIEWFADVARCLEETGAAGVMSAEAHLHNPYVFAPVPAPNAVDVAEEYLALVREHPCALSCARAHLFKLLQHALHYVKDARERIGQARTLEQLERALREVRSALERETPPLASHWFCQPYRRPAVAVNAEAEPTLAAAAVKRTAAEAAEDGDPIALAKLEERKKRKLERQARKLMMAERLRAVGSLPPKFERCPSCINNCVSHKCVFHLCRACCLSKVETEALDCRPHGFNFSISSNEHSACPEPLPADSVHT